MIEGFVKVFNIDQIIIATSINQNDDYIAELSKTCGVSCYRGNENDVLHRFIEAAKDTLLAL